MTKLGVNCPNTDAIGSTHFVRLVDGEMACFDARLGSVTRGIPTNGLNGLDVGDLLVQYSLEAMPNLHKMIVAGYLTKAGLVVEDEPLPVADGSILVRFSQTCFVWSDKNVPDLSWSGNGACKILRFGQSRSERKFDESYDSSYHLRSDALVVMQPGAELLFTKKTSYRAESSFWLSLIPFLKSQPKPDTESVEEFAAIFNGETIEWIC